MSSLFAFVLLHFSSLAVVVDDGDDDDDGDDVVVVVVVVVVVFLSEGLCRGRRAYCTRILGETKLEHLATFSEDLCQKVITTSNATLQHKGRRDPPGSSLKTDPEDEPECS